MEINPNDVKKVTTTEDPEEVNELINEGWTLLDVTRGNLKYLFLLGKTY